MAPHSEWRSGVLSESILIVDDENCVQAAFEVTPLLLSSILTNPGDLNLWRSEREIEGEELDPESWGEFIISRLNEGPIISMSPDLFWDGIYKWFRSRGVDYDSPPELIGA
jgi:hypothetical protein